VEAIGFLLRDLVAERTGIHVDDQSLDIFMDKLSPLVLERGFSPLDSYYLLKYDEAAAEEWRRVVDAISTRETFFWREFEQIRSLTDHIIPRFFATAKIGERFRIWSAACASGEEPITLAMAIVEAGFGDYPIDIVASDASSAAIATARRGIYRERSFRSLAPELRLRYFSQVEGGAWRVNRDIHDRVCWTNANLLIEEEIAPLAASHVIFCRNVFIYFQPGNIKRVVETFARHMKPPACLFVGAPESLVRLTTQFELREIGNAFAYLRSEGGEKTWIA
jgi:chemotaxis protein methyltransferase CheR